MSNVSQGLMLVPVLFNIFINNADGGTECTLSQFADSNWKECLVHQLVLQRDLQHLLPGSPVQGMHGRTGRSLTKGQKDG